MPTKSTVLKAVLPFPVLVGLLQLEWTLHAFDLIGITAIAGGASMFFFLPRSKADYRCPLCHAKLATRRWMETGSHFDERTREIKHVCPSNLLETPALSSLQEPE